VALNKSPALHQRQCCFTLPACCAWALLLVSALLLAACPGCLRLQRLWVLAAEQQQHKQTETSKTTLSKCDSKSSGKMPDASLVCRKRYCWQLLHRLTLALQH
jgi:hypothetical protein